MLTLDLVRNGKLTILGPGNSYPKRNDMLRIKFELRGSEWEANYHKSVYEMWNALHRIGYSIMEETMITLIENFNSYGEYKYSEGIIDENMSNTGEEL